MEVKRLSDVWDALKNNIMSASLIPVLGSGFSTNSNAREGLVPTGRAMREYMIEELNKIDASQNLENIKFSQISSYYNKIVSLNERKKYLYKYFTEVQLPEECVSFLEINWPYIYTLNIDDGIENNSCFEAVGPNKEIDELSDIVVKRVYKLHGDAHEIITLKDADEWFIFDSTQYVDSLQKNKWMLNRLKQDYVDKNILFVGCSLDDELDLMHVFSTVKSELSKKIRTEKYYVTDKNPSRFDIVDLEKYGITTVILVSSYTEFYDAMRKLKIESEKISMKNDIEKFKNITVEILDSKSVLNKDYILYEKKPFNRKEYKIYLPYFFTTRNISNQIIEDMSEVPVQIIYGKRVSGKSYLLLDLVNRIADRDTYYFDSRFKLEKDNIDYLLSKTKTTVLIDTNVISSHVLHYVLNLDMLYLKKRGINIVICINTSKKEDAYEIREVVSNDLIKMYYLNNQFSSKTKYDEWQTIKTKMAAANLLYFNKNKTILDGVIWIQRKIGRGESQAFNKFNVAPDNYMQLVCLILLANYNKITTKDMIDFSIEKEPYELVAKIDKAVEPDYRNYFMYGGDVSSRQIVCNAQAWLLWYLSKISVRDEYLTAILQSFRLIVQQMQYCRKRRDLIDFVKFDNINLLLGSARTGEHSAAVRKVIQAIYSDLKDILGDDYQFNHQHAKCMLWGVESLPDNERKEELDTAIRSILLAQEQAEDAVDYSTNREYYKASVAHINFTYCMIRVKYYFLFPNADTFREAVLQTYKTISFKENLEAFEFFDSKTDDLEDYSVSRFMDVLIENDFSEYSIGLRKEISQIVSFRFKSGRKLLPVT